MSFLSSWKHQKSIFIFFFYWMNLFSGCLLIIAYCFCCSWWVAFATQVNTRLLPTIFVFKFHSCHLDQIFTITNTARTTIYQTMSRAFNNSFFMEVWTCTTLLFTPRLRSCSLTCRNFQGKSCFFQCRTWSGIIFCKDTPVHIWIHSIGTQAYVLFSNHMRSFQTSISLFL